MRLGWTRICIFTVSGANEQCPPKEIVLVMATYLTRPCPRYNGYLGILLLEPGRNMPVRVINGHCLKCGHRLAWIVIGGKRGRLSFTSKPDQCHLNVNAFGCVEKSFQVRKIKIFQIVQKGTGTGPTRVYCSRMDNNTDELAKLRARFIEVKTTLDDRIKENRESLIRIANLNYHIDRLLDKSKRHFITPDG
jgi:hypothetical protein